MPIVVAILVVVWEEKRCSTKYTKEWEKKGSGMGAQLFSRFNQLVDSVSTRSECTSSGWAKKECSIEEVIKDFHSIEKVVFGCEFYCFATEFLMVRSRREIWAAI